MKQVNKFVAALLLSGGLAAITYIGQVNAADDVDAKAVANAQVPLKGAVDIALQNVPGTPISVELERENGVLLWDVEILDNNQQFMEVEIDAISGEVLQQHIDDDDAQEDD